MERFQEQPEAWKTGMACQNGFDNWHIADWQEQIKCIKKETTASKGQGRKTVQENTKERSNYKAFWGSWWNHVKPAAGLVLAVSSAHLWQPFWSWITSARIMAETWWPFPMGLQWCQQEFEGLFACQYRYIFAALVWAQFLDSSLKKRLFDLWVAILDIWTWLFFVFFVDPPVIFCLIHVPVVFHSIEKPISWSKKTGIGRNRVFQLELLDLGASVLKLYGSGDPGADRYEWSEMGPL